MSISALLLSVLIIMLNWVPAAAQGSVASGCMETCRLNTAYHRSWGLKPGSNKIRGHCIVFCKCIANKTYWKWRRSEGLSVSSSERNECFEYVVGPADRSRKTLKPIEKDDNKKTLMQLIGEMRRSPSRGRKVDLANIILSTDPNHKEALQVKALNLAYMGRRKEAKAAYWDYVSKIGDKKGIAYLEKWLRKNRVDVTGSNPRASELYFFGRSLVSKKDYVRGVDLLEKALALDPNLKGALQWRLFAYSGMGEKEKALDAYNEILKRNKDSKFRDSAKRHLEKKGWLP